MSSTRKGAEDLLKKLQEEAKDPNHNPKIDATINTLKASLASNKKVVIVRTKPKTAEEEHGHGHDEHEEDDGEDLVNPLIEAVGSPNKDFNWAIKPDTLDFSILRDHPKYRPVYDAIWDEKSLKRQAFVKCYTPLSMWRYCEDTLGRAKSLKGSKENGCDLPRNLGSFCLGLQFYPKPTENLMKKVFPNVKEGIPVSRETEADVAVLAKQMQGTIDSLSILTQIPKRAINAILECDPKGTTIEPPSSQKGRSVRKEVLNKTMQCVLPKAYPSEYAALVACLKKRETVDLTHPACQTPAVALAERWAALSKARQVTGGRPKAIVQISDAPELDFSIWVPDENGDPRQIPDWKSWQLSSNKAQRKMARKLGVKPVVPTLKKGADAKLAKGKGAPPSSKRPSRG